MAACCSHTTNYELGRVGWPPQVLTKAQQHRQRKKARIWFAGFKNRCADNEDVNSACQCDDVSFLSERAELSAEPGLCKADVAETEDVNSACQCEDVSFFAERADLSAEPGLCKADVADTEDVNSACQCEDVSFFADRAELSAEPGLCKADIADTEDVNSACHNVCLLADHDDVNSACPGGVSENTAMRNGYAEWMMLLKMDDVTERTVCLFADQDDVNSACPIVEMPSGRSAEPGLCKADVADNEDVYSACLTGEVNYVRAEWMILLKMDNIAEEAVCLFADHDTADANESFVATEVGENLIRTMEPAETRSLPPDAAENHENRMADLAETRSLPSNAAENQANPMADLESNVADNEELDSASASDGDSSEWCVAKDDEICVCCIRDNCTVLSKVEYEQYSRKLTGQLAKQQSNKIVTTEADLVAWYLESIEDELQTGIQFDHMFKLICRITDKLVREGVFIATEGQDSDDEVRTLELAN